MHTIAIRVRARPHARVRRAPWAWALARHRERAVAETRALQEHRGPQPTELRWHELFREGSAYSPPTTMRR